MTKDTFESLQDDLSGVLFEGHSNNGKSITPQENLLTFLRSIGGKIFTIKARDGGITFFNISHTVFIPFRLQLFSKKFQVKP